MPHAAHVALFGDTGTSAGAAQLLEIGVVASLLFRRRRLAGGQLVLLPRKEPICQGIRAVAAPRHIHVHIQRRQDPIQDCGHRGGGKVCF